MEAFNEFGPILRELGSARRSLTAGSSDIKQKEVFMTELFENSSKQPG